MPGASGLLAGPGWAIAVPLFVVGELLGAMVLRSETRPTVDESVQATAVLLGQVGAGFFLRASHQEGVPSDNLRRAARETARIDRSPTPIWGVSSVGAARRLLVAEDDPSISEALREALQLEGYVVEAYSSGEAALRAALRSPPIWS